MYVTKGRVLYILEEDSEWAFEWGCFLLRKFVTIDNFVILLTILKTLSAIKESEAEILLWGEKDDKVCPSLWSGEIQEPTAADHEPLRNGSILLVLWIRHFQMEVQMSFDLP